MSSCVIGIAGPSGSGKSVFAQRIYEEVRSTAPELGIVLVKEDAYYHDQSHIPPAEREEVNYDHPDAIDQALLAEHLSALRAGEPVESPVYDYSQHNRTAHTHTLEPAPVILVEGILLFTRAELRESFDMKFFMATPLDLCLLRRMQRDVRERGRTLESVAQQYENTVRPMYDEFIAPSAKHADMLITRGGRNRVALDLLHGRILSLRSAAPAS